jgi:signal recognition particle subunit SRP19
MKDYDRQILWVDYFNSSLSRSDGRRVPTNQAVKNPTLQELAKAAERLKLQAEVIEAAFPKRMSVKTGYLSIPKAKKKSQTIRDISNMLATVRGESRQETKPPKK